MNFTFPWLWQIITNRLKNSFLKNEAMTPEFSTHSQYPKSWASFERRFICTLDVVQLSHLWDEESEPRKGKEIFPSDSELVQISIYIPIQLTFHAPCCLPICSLPGHGFWNDLYFPNKFCRPKIRSTLW